MSNKLPKDCSDCPNSKTVHLTQIVGGAVEKLAVCSACKLAFEADSPETIDIVCEMTVPTVPTGEAQRLRRAACPVRLADLRKTRSRSLAGWAAPAATKYSLAI